MKGRWFSLTAMVSLLALAAVSSAQRGGGGRSSGGSSGGRSSGGSSGGRSSGSPSRSSGDSRPSRSSGGDARSSRPSESRSSRSGETRSSRGDDRSSPFGYASNGRDSRSRDTGSRDRDYRGDRHNLFEGDRGDRSSGGASVSGGRRYDGGSGYVRPGRSGTSFTGGFHNGYGQAGPTHYGGGFNHSVLGVQVERNRPHAGFNAGFGYGGVYGGLRYGYVGYGGYYDTFGYPFYAYDPWSVGVVASPWYRYSYLPPYLDTTHVTVVSDYRSVYDGGTDWSDYEDRSSRDSDLNDALGDIRDAFERNSDRYAERLLPETGQVAIFNEGKYDYSIGPDDFKNMFLDGIEQSKTIRYEITESKVRGDEVHLRARHEYKDSFGQDQTVYHTYTLRRERGRYVIREFGTD